MYMTAEESRGCQRRGCEPWSCYHGDDRGYVTHITHTEDCPRRLMSA